VIRFIEMRHDQREHLVRPQDRIAPRNGGPGFEILSRLVEIGLRPREGIGGETLGEIALAERLDGGILPILSA
jgi:hypothetical protein